MQSSLQLNQLIDRYFAGNTTLEEERQLRSVLAETTEDSPLIRQARAVLSFLAWAPAESIAPRRRFFGPTAQRFAAASIVVAALTAGISYISRSADLTTPQQCYAMVEGTMLNDDNAVENLMLSQLALMGDAADGVDDSVSDDLKLLGDIFE